MYNKLGKKLEASYKNFEEIWAGEEKYWIMDIFGVNEIFVCTTMCLTIFSGFSQPPLNYQSTSITNFINGEEGEEDYHWSNSLPKFCSNN